MKFYSPLRYPGGKGKVADYFKQVFADNFLYDGVYVEPFAGGASVALTLLFDQYASKVVINDIDKSIFAFWHSVLNSTEEICKLIQDTPVNMENWDIQKQIQKNKNNHDLIELGFSTFFLNRTNRSGILKAGVIGGKNQEGKWKIDARFNKDELISRIRQVADFKDNIDLYNEDAVILTRALKQSLPEKTLFYFDPPYYVKGKDLYLNYYKHDDHSGISTEIETIDSQKWIVTYDCVNEIRELYSKYRQIDYNLNYSAAKPSQGKEIIIYSDNLYVPYTEKIKDTEEFCQHAFR